MTVPVARWSTPFEVTTAAGAGRPTIARVGGPDAGEFVVLWEEFGVSSTAFSAVGSGFYDTNATSDILWRNNATGQVGYYASAPNTGAPTWVSLGGSSTAYQVV